MRQIAILTCVALAAGIGVIFWERSTWVAEMKAQCDSAMPLVRAAAPREDVIRKLMNPSVEYTRGDWHTLEENFSRAQEGAKIGDIGQWLQERGRLMIYSRSNSIMFLYLDANGKTSHASCFLQ